MIVAQKKRKENIAEYLLYMWQIEDTIRALKFDFERIKSLLINQYQVEIEQKAEIENWYKNLMLMLEKEQRTQSGHLQFLVNMANDLNNFHQALIRENIDAQYTSLYQDIKPDIDLLREKSKQDHHDIDVVLNTLYIMLMLKLKNNQISEGTQEAVYRLGTFMGALSALYKQYESGDLELSF